MSKIAIVDLEVFFRVGVTDEERAKPQRLLLTVDLDFDFSAAAVTDRVTKTIDYNAVAQSVLKFGEDRNWKLIEKLASDVADHVLSEFRPQAVTVEVKKFPLPQARYVAVRLTRTRSAPALVKRAVWGIP
jgi:FolB domain-containing protein